MALDQVLADAIAKVLKELQTEQTIFDKYTKYKDMDPETIVSEGFAEAVKDKAEIDAYVKEISAASVHAKRLGAIMQDVVGVAAANAQVLSRTLVKLNAAAVAGKAMQASMAANTAQADALKRDADGMESARMEAHPNALHYALDALDQKSAERKTLYDLGSEAGSHWMELGKKISEFQMLAGQLATLMRKATPPK